jgi:hypothetical protein
MALEAQTPTDLLGAPLQEQFFPDHPLELRRELSKVDSVLASAVCPLLSLKGTISISTRVSSLFSPDRGPMSPEERGDLRVGLFTFQGKPYLVPFLTG